MPVDWPFDYSTATATSQTWTSWNYTTTSTTIVWNAWNTLTASNGTHATVTYADGGYVAPARPVETEELRLARVARDDELAAKRKARAEQQEAAKVRAAELLREILTDEQWDAWVKDSAFDLTTEAGNLYRIRRGTAGNVVHIKDGKPVEKLCIHPQTAVYDEDRNYLGDLPTEDVVIAQKLALEADEQEFRRIANITRIAPVYSTQAAA